MSVESSERAKVVFPLAYTKTNKDENWYTFQVTLQIPDEYLDEVIYHLEWVATRLVEWKNEQEKEI